MYRSQVLICGGTGCTSSGSVKIAKRLQEEIDKNGLTDEVMVVRTGCFGLCALGPIMIVYPEGTFYSMVKEEDIAEIVSEHLLKGRIVTRLVYDETVAENEIKSLKETDFYKKQHRIALRNCGVINPECIDEYIGRNGYEALGKVLKTMTPDDVIQVILDSGLRGRGGGGFPTGKKWQLARNLVKDADQKYVCRRGRPRCIHGPFCSRRRSPRCNRGYGYCRLCYRRNTGLYLHKSGISHRCSAFTDSDRSGKRIRSARKEHF